MEQKSHTTKDLKVLSITGKPLQLLSFQEFRQKLRPKSPEAPRGTSVPSKQYLLDKTFVAINFNPLISNNASATILKNLSKAVKAKSILKNQISESFKLENGAKVYKCMSNPNINGNSNTLGHPIRSINPAIDITVPKTPFVGLKRKSITPKLLRMKIMQKRETLISSLQKSNGIQCFPEEDYINKYFIGPGNNSALIAKVMKTRQRWKRVYSHIGAHFIWTACKKYSIYECLGSLNTPAEQIWQPAISEFPQILAQNHFCHLSPQKSLNPMKSRLYNHLMHNKELTSKKRLFYNMSKYYTSINIDPFTKIPMTYHVSYGSCDAAFKIFTQKFKELQRTGQPNVWIIKPGECTNRGFGIHVCSTLEQIAITINNYDSEVERTFVIQKYIDNPLLYKGRKFDIRCYALITSIQGNVQGFFYREGYLRTSSTEFDLKDVENKYIHLTNDAVQKYAAGYGKHEAGNKLSYAEFQAYLEETHKDVDFFKQILPQIKELVTDTILATYHKLDPNNKLHCFEVLGYDMMIDSKFKVWLIEVNTNPCLELSSPYLEFLIPKMIQNAFELTVDQIFPCESQSVNSFEMVFNEANFAKPEPVIPQKIVTLQAKDL